MGKKTPSYYKGAHLLFFSALPSPLSADSHPVKTTTKKPLLIYRKRCRSAFQKMAVLNYHFTFIKDEPRSSASETADLSPCDDAAPCSSSLLLPYECQHVSNRLINYGDVDKQDFQRAFSSATLFVSKKKRTRNILHVKASGPHIKIIELIEYA